MDTPTPTYPARPVPRLISLVSVAMLGLLACVAPGAAIALDDGLDLDGTSGGDTDTGNVGASGDGASGLHAEVPTSTMKRSDLLQLTEEQCLAELRAANVDVEPLDADNHRGVEMPVRLRGPVHGVAVTMRGHDAIHEVLDCRLAVALSVWAPALRARGITRVEHYSIYRPGARTPRKRKPSGHARGLAIDAARFHLEDGRLLDVLSDWGASGRGVDPCLGDVDNPDEDRTLRELVCEAVARELFTVVLTPHHDKAHDNHVHLELIPDVTWSYVR